MLPAKNDAAVPSAVTSSSLMISPPPMRPVERSEGDDDFLFGCDVVDPADDLFFEHLDASEAFASPTTDHPLPPIPDPAPLPLFGVGDVSATSSALPRQLPRVPHGEVACPTPLSFPPPLDRFQSDATASAMPSNPGPLPVFPGDDAAGGDNLLSSAVTSTLLDEGGSPTQTAAMPGTIGGNKTSGPSNLGHAKHETLPMIMGNSTGSPTSAGTSCRTVCMLVVGTIMPDRSPMETVPLRPAGSLPGLRNDSGIGLAGVISMLTRELDRHGLKPEIDQVTSGERAVQRVKALARHGLRYRMVVLGVAETLSRAAATARDLRCVRCLV